MIVSELIKELQKFDGEMEVLVAKNKEPKN